MDGWNTRQVFELPKRIYQASCGNEVRVINAMWLRSRMNENVHVRLWNSGEGSDSLADCNRALRPAVIARKVSHCSKKGAGAQAFAAFTSVVHTLAKQRVDSLVENLYRLFRGPDIQVTPP
jgi:hypothetical protein